VRKEGSCTIHWIDALGGVYWRSCFTGVRTDVSRLSHNATDNMFEKNLFELDEKRWVSLRTNCQYVLGLNLHCTFGVFLSMNKRKAS